MNIAATRMQKKFSGVFNLVMFVGLTTLVGCQFSTAPYSAGVDNNGQDVFITTYKVRGGMANWNEVKRKSYDQASAFCEKKGMKMHEVQMATKGARGWTPQESSLRFTCMR